MGRKWQWLPRCAEARRDKIAPVPIEHPAHPLWMMRTVRTSSANDRTSRVITWNSHTLRVVASQWALSLVRKMLASRCLFGYALLRAQLPGVHGHQLFGHFIAGKTADCPAARTLRCFASQSRPHTTLPPANFLILKLIGASDPLLISGTSRCFGC